MTTETAAAITARVAASAHYNTEVVAARKAETRTANAMLRAATPAAWSKANAAHEIADARLVAAHFEYQRLMGIYRAELHAVPAMDEAALNAAWGV